MYISFYNPLDMPLVHEIGMCFCSIIWKKQFDLPQHRNLYNLRLWSIYFVFRLSLKTTKKTAVLFRLRPPNSPAAKSELKKNGKVFSGMFLPLCTHDYRWALPLAIKMTSIALNEIQVQWDGIYFDWKSTCDFANKKTCRTSKLIFFQ